MLMISFVLLVLGLYAFVVCLNTIIPQIFACKLGVLTCFIELPFLRVVARPPPRDPYLCELLRVVARCVLASGSCLARFFRKRSSVLQIKPGTHSRGLLAAVWRCFFRECRYFRGKTYNFYAVFGCIFPHAESIDFYSTFGGCTSKSSRKLVIIRFLAIQNVVFDLLAAVL